MYYYYLIKIEYVDYKNNIVLENLIQLSVVVATNTLVKDSRI